MALLILLSGTEVPGMNEESIIRWMRLIFAILDKNNDEVLEKEEFVSASLDLNNVNDILNFTFESLDFGEIPIEVFRNCIQIINEGGNITTRFSCDDSTGELESNDYGNFHENEDYGNFHGSNDYGFVHGSNDYGNISESISDDPNEVFRMSIPPTDEVPDRYVLIDDIFHLLDQNDDNLISADDIKQIAQIIVPLYFALLDSNDDETLSIEDIKQAIQWEDVNNILALFDNKQMDLNRYLIPWGLDVNFDGQMNNLDFYMFSQSGFYFTGIFSGIPHMSKLLDQNQDGIYKSSRLRQFIEKVWEILDANKDQNVSIEDGYLLLENKFAVEEANVNVLKEYLDSVRNFIKASFRKFVTDCLFNRIDGNSNDEITFEELMNAYLNTANTPADLSCMGDARFPDMPSALFEENYFPTSHYLDPEFTPWMSRMTAFSLASLDSAAFYEDISE